MLSNQDSHTDSQQNPFSNWYHATEAKTHGFYQEETGNKKGPFRLLGSFFSLLWAGLVEIRIAATCVVLFFISTHFVL
jgi:hypothetical protein